MIHNPSSCTDTIVIIIMSIIIITITITATTTIIMKVTTNHLHDEIVLEWGLRVLYHLSLEKGMLLLMLLQMQMISRHSSCLAICLSVDITYLVYLSLYVCTPLIH